MGRRESRYKLHAYKLFKSGVPLHEIPEKLGCSKALIYKWAKNEAWASPLQSSLARIESAARKLQDGEESGITEALQSKAPGAIQ